MKKKILILLSLLLMPIYVYAAAVDEVDYSVEAVYTSAEVDAVGSMHVKEAIVVNGSLNGYKREIDYKNPKLGEWKQGDKVNYEHSGFYNARGVSLSKVSSAKITSSDINFEVLNRNYTSYTLDSTARKGDSGKYTSTTKTNGQEILIYNPNSSGYVVYYFDYYIDQVVVLHNDIAELYWQFIPTDMDNIKEAHIQVKLPGKSNNDTFRFWAHGPLTGEIVGANSVQGEKDETGKYLYDAVIANATKVKKGQGLDIRVTFNKNIMESVRSILNESNEDALDKIIVVETKRADEANNKRRLSKIVYYGFMGLSGAYVIGIIILWVHMYRKYDKEYDVNFDHKYYREFTEDYDVEVIDYLMNKKITTNAMSASIMNLIYKKKIGIKENQADKKNPTLQELSREDISASEKKIMELLFDLIGNGGLVSTKEIEKFSKKASTAEKFMNKYNSWVSSVESAAVKEDFYEDLTSKRTAAGAYVLLGIVIIVLMAIMDAISPLSIILIIASSIAFILYVSTFKKMTRKGREHYLKWTAFKNFLKDFGQFKEKELPEIALWERYLVYATVFGLAKEVQKTMKVKLQEFGYSDTYYGSYWYYNDFYIGNHISNTINHAHSTSMNVTNRELANSSYSSGSGFGGGFSGGGGFGGGGGSGSGF